MTRFHPVTLIAALAVAGLMGAVPALANPTNDPPPPPTDQKSNDQKSTEKPKKKHKQSFNEFRRDYQAAFALIDKGDFAGGIAAMRALGRDDDTNVATEVGFAYRKLGDYDKSRAWYEKALAANPDNTRTLQYFGEWYLEQGNRLKAEDNLQKIRLICGTADCKDYRDLKTAIDTGRTSY